MARTKNEASSKKLTVSFVGIAQDLMDIIPEGKKSAILHQMILSSIANDEIFNILAITLGVKEARRVNRKFSKLIDGVAISNISTAVKTTKNGFDDVDLDENDTSCKKIKEESVKDTKVRNTKKKVDDSEDDKKNKDEDELLKNLSDFSSLANGFANSQKKHSF